MKKHNKKHNKKSLRRLTCDQVIDQLYRPYPNLSGADLRVHFRKGGVLAWSNSLADTDFRGSNLRGARIKDCCRSDFRGADLRGAKLYCCWGTDFRGVDLRAVDFRNGDVMYAKYNKYTKWPTRPIPPKGQSIIGWKKLSGGLICKLHIPAHAQRMQSLTSNKCRASEAKVLEIFVPKTGRKTDFGFSRRYDSFRYTVGKTVRPEEAFNPNPTKECSSGIHFFLTRRQAVQYIG